jgi:folate-dependent phosphoribosylglycinamide formyltransferase PurN
MLNITVLCDHPDSLYAREVLQALNAHGLSGIHVVAAAGSPTPWTWDTLWAAYGWRLPQGAARWVCNRVVQQFSGVFGPRASATDSLQAKALAQGGQYIKVEKINSHACCQALQTLQTDLMLLAGTPIVRAPILAVPRIGTLNAHQGALPQFRGMNVVEWAIMEGHPPSITVHFVDPGVDTGDIVVTEPIPLQPGDTLSAVLKRASIQQLDLLARTVIMAQDGPLPCRPQGPEEGRQYFIMHPRLRSVAERLLKRRLLILSET